MQDEALCSQKSRQTPLGEIIDESRELVKHARESKNKTLKTPPNGQYASRTPSPGLSDLIQNYNERMSERIEIRKIREDRKRQKLDVERERIANDNKLMEQKLDVERQRIAYENKRMEMEQARLKLVRRHREASTAFFQTMVTKLYEQMNKK
jgi:hypothetical protein